MGTIKQTHKIPSDSLQSVMGREERSRCRVGSQLGKLGQSLRKLQKSGPCVIRQIESLQ